MTTAPPEALARALANRYLLERELGRGGMATVYLAHDLKHKRQVALKVLSPELGAVLGTERFLREIETAAQLQHPHILPVFDSGEAAGQLWYTMPFVDGESLRDRLRREGPLSVAEAVRLTQEIAGALQATHDRGVIHRDVKPENVLLSHGHALVADFGIAHRATPVGSKPLTQTGFSVGTPAYMAPEQALGDHALDGRADIYALGCLLYELLAGQPPFIGISGQAVIAAHLTEPVPDLRQARPEVPPAVAAAVTRALAKQPAARFPTASMFALALGASDASLLPTVAIVPPPMQRPSWLRPAGAIVLVLSIIAGAWIGLHRRAPATATAAGATRLAVLPFENLGDTADAYFVEGLTGELRGQLAAVPALEVIGSTSSNTYRRTAKAPTAVAQELGVRYILVGHVQWDRRAPGGGRLRVSPELIDGRTGLTKWEQPFDAAATDLFQVQADIASRVAAALNVTLGTDARAGFALQPATTPDAYDAYLRAKAAYDELVNTGQGEKIPQVLAYAKEAIAADSTFGPAWALVSIGHGLATDFFGCVGCAKGDSARAAATRAITLAPHRSEGYYALAKYYDWVAGDAAGSLQAAESGLRQVPNDPDLLGAAAWALGTLGQWDRALVFATRAEAIDPRSLAALSSHARLLVYLRRYDELRALCRRGLAIAPRYVHFIAWQMVAALGEGDSAAARTAFEQGAPGLDLATLVTGLTNLFLGGFVWVMPERARTVLLTAPAPASASDRFAWAAARAEAYRVQGDSTRAREYDDSSLVAFDEAFRNSPPDVPWPHGVRASLLARTGRSARAKTELALARGPWKHPDAFFEPTNEESMATAYVLLGEPDQAVDILEVLVHKPYWLTPAWLRISPLWSRLRGNPRFARLVSGK